jgi:hypothetical protein
MILGLLAAGVGCSAKAPGADHSLVDRTWKPWAIPTDHCVPFGPTSKTVDSGWGIDRVVFKPDGTLAIYRRHLFAGANRELRKNMAYHIDGSRLTITDGSGGVYPYEVQGVSRHEAVLQPPDGGDTCLLKA